MKNKSLKFILCTVMVTLTLSFTACGNSNDAENAVTEADAAGTEEEGADEADADVEDAVEAETEESDVEAETEESDTDGAEVEGADTEDGAMVDGKYATMSDFVNSDEIQSQITTLTEQMEGTGMNMGIRGEDNKLIYSYQFEDVENSTELAESLEAEMANQASTFTAVASSCKLAVNVENPVVVVEYIDMNGEIIYSQEFPAE